MPPNHQEPSENRKGTIRERARKRATPPERGSRLSPHFEITPALTEWAQQRVPAVDIAAETEKFRNHWAAASGPNAVKRDWAAAWRNWMLKAAEWAGTRPAANGQRRSTVDDRFNDALAAGRRLQAQRDRQQRLEIEA